jgi:hypothetical protein
MSQGGVLSPGDIGSPLVSSTGGAQIAALSKQQVGLVAAAAAAAAAAQDADAAAAAAGDRRLYWPWSDTTSRHQFLARFGYLGDDLVGDDPSLAVTRVTPAVLMYYPLNIIHRTVLAAVFGSFHFAAVSMPQLVGLLLVQLAMLVYMLTVRPVIVPIIHWAEVASLVTESVLLVTGLSIIYRPGSQPALETLLAGYFICVVLIVLPDLVRYAWALVNWSKARRARSKLSKSSAARRG